ncbi:MAG: SRPBCC family protein [bacterium]|nr:SRPBCC family protein [bacterium]
MIRTVNSILIKASIDRVFSVAADMEKYPEFIPSYKEVKVVNRDGNKMIVERLGQVGEKTVKWKSCVTLTPLKSIQAEQLEGPIKGMQIQWLFEDTKEGVKIILIHDFEYKKIPLIGNLIGRLIVARIVKKMAEETLKGIKTKVEGKR